MTLALSCSTVSEALSRIGGARCDALLLGSPADSSASAAVVRLAGSRVPIVVLGPDPATLLIRKGAAGAIGLEAEPARIVAALQAAAAGLVVAEAGLLELGGEPAESDGLPLEAPAATATGTSAPPLEALSARETELLRHLAEGYTNKEIARVMVLAEDTVKKAVQSLIAKLGATDRTHAVVLALRQGLIE